MTMMRGAPDILFMTEYIKNVLYFATVRQGKVLKSTPEIHYFCVDNELVYENYYSDFGPLNIGCVYKYCKSLNEKIKQFLNKQTIIHYTSIEPKKKANSAFLLACYGVLYLSLQPRDALKPLLLNGQTYRAFQDATQGDSIYTISLLDCVQAFKRARELGFFSFSDFNYEEYERLDKIQGGDLNWIVPAKFLAFIGPVDYNVSLYHPPEMYIEYFRENNVKIVIRLNKRMYDGAVFNCAGILHYDLFFPDGSCPPRHILSKFLQISEEADGAIAVHCKAGLGRTGSLIGCYLMKHYRMTAHEAIGWMRICRPGSVIGHQQAWLEQLEPWLIKQGNLYRKRTFQDTEKLPTHQYGIYSIAEKATKQRPVVFSHSISPPPPINRQSRSETIAPARPQASRTREDKSSKDEEEKFITSCDLTIQPDDATKPTLLKGCVLKKSLIPETSHDDSHDESQRKGRWKKYLCCKPCIRVLNDGLWMLAVHCARITPKSLQTSCCCSLLDMVAPGKAAAEKDYSDCRVRSSKMSTNQKVLHKGEPNKTPVNALSRRVSGAGEPRPTARPSHTTTNSRLVAAVQRAKEKANNSKNAAFCTPVISTFRTTQGPEIKTLDDARNYLLRSSMYNQQREKQLNSAITVTPRYSFRTPNYTIEHAIPVNNVPRIQPSPFTSVSRGPSQPQQRRRLGRSPSPSPSPSPTRYMDQNRATNTSMVNKYLAKESSKSALREALSRLKLSGPRGGSIGTASVGAASLGARRDAPPAKPAPSVRSDERPIATQGDMLNSIKFQRRFRETLNADKLSGKFNDRMSFAPKDKSFSKETSSRASNTADRLGFGALEHAYPTTRYPSPPPSLKIGSPSRARTSCAGRPFSYDLDPNRTQRTSLLTPKDKPVYRDANFYGNTYNRLGFNQDFSTPQRGERNAANASRPHSPLPQRLPSPKTRPPSTPNTYH